MLLRRRARNTRDLDSFLRRPCACVRRFGVFPLACLPQRPSRADFGFFSSPCPLCNLIRPKMAPATKPDATTDVRQSTTVVSVCVVLAMVAALGFLTWWTSRLSDELSRARQFHHNPHAHQHQREDGIPVSVLEGFPVIRYSKMACRSGVTGRGSRSEVNGSVTPLSSALAGLANLWPIRNKSTRRKTTQAPPS